MCADPSIRRPTATRSCWNAYASWHASTTPSPSASSPPCAQRSWRAPAHSRIVPEASGEASLRGSRPRRSLRRCGHSDTQPSSRRSLPRRTRSSVRSARGAAGHHPSANNTAYLPSADSSPVAARHRGSAAPISGGRSVADAPRQGELAHVTSAASTHAQGRPAYARSGSSSAAATPAVASAL